MSLRKIATLALIAAAALAGSARAEDPPPRSTDPPRPTDPPRAEDPPRAAPSPEVRDLQRRYEELLANQRRLEQQVARQELRERDREAKVPVFGLGPDGFFIGARDTFEVRLRAVIQADGRAFFAQTPPIPDTFLIRRARPIVEGTVGNVLDFRLVPDFAGGQVQLFDAYIDFRPFTWLAVRGGKFKNPFGLERLQQDQYLLYLERGLPSNLAPDRDEGVAFHGAVAGGALLYEIAIVNGAPDGASVDQDINDAKDYLVRVFSHPLRPLGKSWLKDFGIGFASSWGQQHGNTSTTGLAPYKTAGQNVFFSYLASTTGGAVAVALGDCYRLAPQLYYYVGPFGLLGEYTYSSTRVSVFGNPSATIVNQAWQVEVSCVLTGERASYEGVYPKHPLNLRKRQFGAVDVGARYEELRVDAAAFPTYADPAKSARAALAWGVVSNWYFTHHAKFGMLFERTTFTGGNGKGDRVPENALIGRLQIGF